MQRLQYIHFKNYLRLPWEVPVYINRMNYQTKLVSKGSSIVNEKSIAGGFCLTDIATLFRILGIGANFLPYIAQVNSQGMLIRGFQFRKFFYAVELFESFSLNISHMPKLTRQIPKNVENKMQCKNKTKTKLF